MGPAPFDLSRKVLIVIVLIIAALETDHQAALFRIEAAQCGGGFDGEPAIGVPLQNRFFQRVCLI